MVDIVGNNGFPYLVRKRAIGLEYFNERYQVYIFGPFEYWRKFRRHRDGVGSVPFFWLDVTDWWVAVVAFGWCLNIAWDGVDLSKVGG